MWYIQNMKGGAAMNYSTFMTETDPKYVRQQSNKASFIIFLVLSLLACLGFFVAWQTFVFFEAIVIISCFAALVSSNKKGHYWRLEFEDDALTIINLKTNESYSVYDVPASDFVITQSGKEANLDYCTLLIKNTIFAFGGVKNCVKLKAYIQENYR